MSERQSPYRLIGALRKMLEFARPYRRRLVLAVVLTMVASAVWLAVPMGVRALLDAVFQADDLALLNRMAIILLVLFVAQSVLSFAGTYLLEWTGERVVADLRKRLYERMTRHDLHFFSNQRIGDLTSRLTNDVGSIRTAVTSSLVDLLSQSLSLIGSVVLMVLLNWRLSVMVFVIVPAATLLARHFGSRIRLLSREIQDRLADTTAIAEEALGAVRVVKAFARESHEVEKYGTSVESLFATSRRTVIVRILFSSIIGLLFFGALVAIFWYGGMEVLAGRLTAGDLVAFIFYAFFIARSVGGMSRLYGAFNTAAGASERIFDLIEAVPSIRDRPDARPIGSVAGDVAFEAVSFRYEDDVPVLRDISFRVAPGETVALVGRSGAGKTTLLNLIPRFFEPQEGFVTIDGADVREVTLRSLREEIAVVPQDVYLFNTSIRENIRYGRLEASDEEVEAAAVAANVGDFAERLPGGYESIIGERGVKLSGGEKQRLSIARAILKNAPILLLDEATSSLDSASEALVQEALDRLMAGRTTFIIAHRLSTVQHADRILVLEGGRIVQTGTHEQLAAQEGLYRELASLQFGAVAA